MFVPADGCTLKAREAKIVGRELSAISKRHGHFTPENVLDAARSEESPLHRYFEWDDAVAGEKYRLDQARHLIRSVKVIYSDTQPRPVRAFCNVAADNTLESVYVPITVAISNPNYRKQILSTAYNELKAWQNKYSDLNEFASVFKSIEKAEKVVS